MLHIAHLDHDPENAIDTPKNQFLPVTLDTTPCLALPDSGNNWRNVISESLMTRLGYTLKQLRPLLKHKVSSANKSPLVVLGELPMSIPFRIHGLSTPFKTRPAVIRHLHTDFNISINFMRAHGINELHAENCIQKGIQKIPLVPQSTLGTEAIAAVLQEDVVLLPQSQALLPLKLQNRSSNEPRHGDGFLQGTLAFLEKTSCCPWTKALVTVKNDTLIGGAINLHNHPIKIKKGQIYGHCSPIPEIPTVAAMQFSKSHPRTRIPQSTAEKRAWLDEQFHLTSSPILKSPHMVHEAMELLLHHYDTFSKDGTYGKTHLVQHEIHLTPGPPIREKFRPLNPVLEADLKETLAKWKRQDIIEESHSPWSFALVPVPKKNGKIRWATDYRKLNNRTIRDSIPLPVISDNLSRLSKSRVFSCIDGAGAFLAVPMHPEDKEKTAFSTPFGLFQYKRMPFGLMNAPATYTRLVQRVLEDIPPEIA